MPKTYSQIEKDNIKRGLKREAGLSLARFGVKRTTVDLLVEGVGIPKGTFYLFYKSKEELFLDLILSFNSEVENYYLSMLQELDENHIVESLTDVFTSIAMKFYKDGVYKFLDDRELKLVTRKIEGGGEETKAFDIRHEIIEKLFSYFYIDNKEDIASFSGSFEALLYILLHDDNIEGLEKKLRHLIRGLVLEMVEN